MARCRSWFPAQQDRHRPLHAPGRCRVCWRPCRNRVPGGVERCDDCADTLALHPSPRVRRSLAQQTRDPQLLAFLVTDLSAAVAAAARTRQADLAAPGAVGFGGSGGSGEARDVE